MSTIIMSACWPLQGMSPAQKSVLVSLADNANDEGVCWPSVKKIAMRTCLSERAVQSAIRWLIDAKLIAAHERNGRSTIYTVTPAAYAPLQDVRTTSADAAPRPPQMPHPTPAAPAPRTVKEPSVEPKANRKKHSAKFDPVQAKPENVTMPVWLEWCRFRREIRKPLTETTCRQQAKLLGGLPNADAVILKSVANGWTGLFPEKSAPRSKPSPMTQDFSTKTYESTPDDQLADFLQ